MAGPIFMLWVARTTEAWYQLSEEEREQLGAKHNELFETTGGENTLMCWSGWSTEEWPFFGVHEFPDIEAVQKHAENLEELDWHRYFEAKTMLGTRWEPES